jgi:hypothetical protein
MGELQLGFRRNGCPDSLTSGLRRRRKTPSRLGMGNEGAITLSTDEAEEWASLWEVWKTLYPTLEEEANTFDWHSPGRHLIDAEGSGTAPQSAPSWTWADFGAAQPMANQVTHASGSARRAAVSVLSSPRGTMNS